MRIHLDIDTANETLSENDRVVLLALAGEIHLADIGGPQEAAPTLPPTDEEAAPFLDAIAEVADEVREALNEAAEPETAEEKPKRARVVNVSDESLKKYDFRRDEDGDIVCNHCDHVSETGRALHLHAGTHKDDAPAKEKALKSVPDPVEKEPEAGVDAFLGSAEEDPAPEDVADAESAAAGDPETEVAEPPAPVEAKVASPKELRDKVAKVATEMVAAQKQSDIRKVLDELGVARVSMIEEKDLQFFLDAEPIAEFIAKKAG